MTACVTQRRPTDAPSRPWAPGPSCWRLPIPTNIIGAPCLFLYVANIRVVNLAECNCTANMLLGLKCAVFDPLLKRSECYSVKKVKSPVVVAWPNFLSVYDEMLLHAGNVLDGIISCYNVFLRVEK